MKVKERKEVKEGSEGRERRKWKEVKVDSGRKEANE